jgi:DNA repair exonuclease SbcCD ATPase subunit
MVIITLTNFKTYESQTFNLGNSGLVLLSGVSGKGKTTILEAIYFCLYGKGSKVITHNKSSCKVQMLFNDFKIIRTKRPNILTVNDIHEDEAAQEIINNKFGNTFDVSSYVNQNYFKSFIYLSPVEKLSFLEKFAFNQFNLIDIKAKCKETIHEHQQQLIASTSKLELSKEILNNHVEPKLVEFPISCNKKNIDKHINNENIKYKNTTIKIKKHNKHLRFLSCERHSTELFIVTNESTVNELKTIDSKLNQLIHDTNNTTYEGDDKLTEYKSILECIKQSKEYDTLKTTIQIHEEKLNIMKKREIDDINSRISQINEYHWEEYTNSEIKELINEYEIFVSDIIELNRLELEYTKYEWLTDDYITDLQLKTDKYSNDINIITDIYNNLVLKQKVYTCPSCKSHLKFDKDTVHLETHYKIDNTYTLEEITIEKADLEQLKAKLDKQLRKYKNELVMKQTINTQIQNIKVCYDEIKELKELKEDLDYIKSYKIEHESLDSEKHLLQSNLNNDTYSKSYNIDNNDLNILKSKFANLTSNCDHETPHNYSEDEIKDIIREQKYQNESLQKLKQEEILIKNRQIELIDALEMTKISHLQTYGSVSTIADIDINITKCTNNIQKLLDIKTEQENILEQIELWKSYANEYDTYNGWKTNVCEYQKLEDVSKNKLSAVSTFKNIILEAESIALLHIVDEINTHCQIFLDMFFPEDPLIAQIVPFKESTSKASINIEIQYKSMQCDISMLSGGESARVSLAFTLALSQIFNSPIIMLDECTASLDEELTNTVFNSIKSTFNDKLVIIVAHQISEALFDKVIQL